MRPSRHRVRRVVATALGQEPWRGAVYFPLAYPVPCRDGRAGNESVAYVLVFKARLVVASHTYGSGADPAAFACCAAVAGAGVR